LKEKTVRTRALKLFAAGAALVLSACTGQGETAKPTQTPKPPAPIGEWAAADNICRPLGDGYIALSGNQLKVGGWKPGSTSALTDATTPFRPAVRALTPMNNPTEKDLQATEKQLGCSPFTLGLGSHDPLRPWTHPDAPGVTLYLGYAQTLPQEQFRDRQLMLIKIELGSDLAVYAFPMRVGSDYLLDRVNELRLLAPSQERMMLNSFGWAFYAVVARAS
jgi:hypothetical protein